MFPRQFPVRIGIGCSQVGKVLIEVFGKYLTGLGKSSGLGCRSQQQPFHTEVIMINPNGRIEKENVLYLTFGFMKH
jgi:hypothetical protein